MSETIDRLRDHLSDRYAVERELGQGGMATVFLARDRKHDRPVAIKVLHPDLAASVGSDRFLREIEIAAKLQHPHILPVYDSGDADGLLYYVMPFVEGESLKDRIDRAEAIPAAEAVRLTREVASALDYAHREGIVHRDIKPANILLSQGHAVVADFGIARAITVSADKGLTQAGTAIGTPWYMSPEQALAEAELDGRADIYSLACVLYEMLSGSPPFDGSTAQAIIAKCISGTVPKLEHDELGVQPALRRALEKDPDDRFSTAREFAGALGSDGGMGRRRHTATVAALSAVVTVVVVAGLFWIRSGTPQSAVAPDAEVIAVMPFTATGPNVQLLGEGMVDLLATNLNAVGGIRIVDPRIVLQQWRKREDGGTVTLEDARAIGRDVDAGSILVGSVTEAGDDVRVRGQLLSVVGEELASASLDGPASAVLRLVDSLSVLLLQDIWRSGEPLPSLRVSAITSGSIDAIRAYLRGAQFFRRAQWDSATGAFQEALAEDSTFALALYYLASTYGWDQEHGSQDQQVALNRAAGMLDRLPVRERSLVTAARLFRDDPFTALDTLREFVDRFPEDPTGWEQLGDAQYHLRSLLELDVEELFVPFERAMGIDPSFVPAYFHPLEIAFALADSARVARYFRTVDEEAAGSDFTDRYQLAADIVWGDPDSTNARLDRLAHVWPAGIPLVVSSSYRGAPLTPAATLGALDSVRRAARADGRVRAAASIGVLTTLLSLGRVDEARALAFEEFEQSPVIGSQLVAAMGSSGYINSDEAEPAFRVMEGSFVGPSVAPFLRMITALNNDDPDEARRVFDGFLGADTTRVFPAFRAALHAFAGATLVATGDTAAGLAAMEDVFRTAGVGNVTSTVFVPVRYEYAELLAAIPERRAEGIRLLRSGFTDGIIENFAALPHALLTLGDALEAEGDREGAAVAYARLVDLWEHADTSLQPQVAAARERIAALTVER